MQKRLFFLEINPEDLLSILMCQTAWLLGSGRFWRFLGGLATELIAKSAMEVVAK